MAIDYQAELMREIEAAFEDGFEGQLEDPWGYADAGWEYQVPPQPAITVVDLAGRLADRVFLARNPGQRGKTLSLGSRKAAERQRILDAEIWPLLRRDSAERTVSQLIFFARHPDVRGRFQQLPKNRQQALSNEFGSIRTAEVQPIFAIPIARGRVKSAPFSSPMQTSSAHCRRLRAQLPAMSSRRCSRSSGLPSPTLLSG